MRKSEHAACLETCDSANPLSMQICFQIAFQLNELYNCLRAHVGLVVLHFVSFNISQLNVSIICHIHVDGLFVVVFFFFEWIKNQNEIVIIICQYGFLFGYPYLRSASLNLGLESTTILTEGSLNRSQLCVSFPRDASKLTIPVENVFSEWPRI